MVLIFVTPTVLELIPDVMNRDNNA
jgi:hypothetical protein